MRIRWLLITAIVCLCMGLTLAVLIVLKFLGASFSWHWVFELFCGTLLVFLVVCGIVIEDWEQKNLLRSKEHQ